MEKRKVNLNDYPEVNEIAKPLERLMQGKPTEEDKVIIREVIWTISCKEVVKSLLTDLPMQQKELAKELNVTPAMITAYKQGTKLPSMPTFFMMCQRLNPEMAEKFTNGTIQQVNEILKPFNFQL